MFTLYAPIGAPLRRFSPLKQNIILKHYLVKYKGNMGTYPRKTRVFVVYKKFVFVLFGFWLHCCGSGR